MVGYSHLHIASLAAMPTTHRTNDHTHTITRTDERFGLWRIIIIIIISGVSTAA